MTPPEVAAVLLAGGRGERAASPVPKQFLDLCGRAMLCHSLVAFEGTPSISSVVVVLPEHRPEGIEEAVDFPKVAALATGGPSRQDSLREGLRCLPPGAQVVLVHDAARPLIRPEDISRILDGLEEGWDGAIPAIPVDDALKEVSPAGEILRSLARAGLWRAQTPQAFLRGPLEDSVERAASDGDLADDCAELCMRAGYRVRALRSDPWNLKVTRSEDLTLCARILEARGSPAPAGSPLR